MSDGTPQTESPHGDRQLSLVLLAHVSVDFDDMVEGVLDVCVEVGPDIEVSGWVHYPEYLDRLG